MGRAPIHRYPNPLGPFIARLYDEVIVQGRPSASFRALYGATGGDPSKADGFLEMLIGDEWATDVGDGNITPGERTIKYRGRF